MITRTFGVIIFAIAVCANCFGQSSYKGLTPSQSTRADVERVLGRPVKSVSATLIEYRPQPLTIKIYVQYRKTSPVVERIEVLCKLENSTCNDLIKSLGLTLPTETNAGMIGEQKLRVLYGPPLFIVTSTDMAGVTEADVPPSSLAFYSPELYEAEFERIDKSNTDLIAKIEQEQHKAPALSGVYGEITGIVKLRAADGSLQPVAGATVDFYRIDLSGHLQTKTDKYGVFRSVGLSQTGKWTVVVSGPGLKWNGFRNVQTPKAGIEIVLEPGDGARPTPEQVMAAIR